MYILFHTCMSAFSALINIMSHKASESFHCTFWWISALCYVLCILESSLQSFKIVCELLHQYSMDHNQRRPTQYHLEAVLKWLMSYSCQLPFDEVIECFTTYLEYVYENIPIKSYDSYFFTSLSR